MTELMVGSGGNVRCVDTSLSTQSMHAHAHDPSQYRCMHRLMLGEAFMEVSEDFATEYCEKKQEELQARVEELGAEKERVQARQQVCMYHRLSSLCVCMCA